MSETITALAPCCAAPMAIARPMPLAAPVTRAAGILSDYPRARSASRERRRSQLAPTWAIQSIASASGAGVST